MTLDVDPRAWNLLAGLTVVAGCGSHTISLEGDATDSINDGETTQNPDSGPDSGPETGPETGPECVDGSDCPYGYYCYDGVCEYVPHHDGHVPYYQCYSDYECGSLFVCEFNYCQYVYSPPQCDLVLPQGPVFEILEPVLALAFVDVDSDGARELVAATQTQLHVMENGSPTPVSHPRGIESSSVDAMVGGAFDGMPGDDVVVLHDDQLDLNGSDGLGNLLPALGAPSPFPGTLGLEAGAFDVELMTDLLAWGTSTTGVIYGTGETLGLLGEAISSASTRDLGMAGDGFTLLRGNELLFLDIGGFITGTVFLYGASPHAQASFDALGQAGEVGSSNVAGWTLIEFFDWTTANLSWRWGLLGTVGHMRSGDLDSVDSTSELALIVDDALWLYVSGECLLQVPLDGAVTALAFGDHDGDGDDELAVSTANTISIIDVE
jgi:hypothetical protein